MKGKNIKKQYVDGKQYLETTYVVQVLTCHIEMASKNKMLVIKDVWARHISVKYGYLTFRGLTHRPRKGVSIENNFLDFSNPKVFKVGCCDHGDMYTDSIKGWEYLDCLK